MVPFTISYGQRRTNIVRAGSVEDYYRMYSIIGIDEVGLGSVAGPLVLAAVHLPDDHGITGLKDSKRMTASAIDSKAVEISDKADIAIAEMGLSTEIDEAGVRDCHSTLVRALIKRAHALVAPHKVPLVVIDGTWDPGPACMAFVLIKKADDKSYNVSAASIIAKSVRDRMMSYAALDYPGYDFDRNKGYPTPAHKAAVQRLGTTDIHRLSYTNFYR